MHIEAPEMDETDEITDLWVELARDQRKYGSHLLASSNRSVVHDSVARHVVGQGLLVARDPDIVGFVMFSPETGEYDQDVDRGAIRNLFVRPDRRGEGIGTALLADAEEALADAGADVVTLEAMAHNEDARRFYEQRGYRVHRVEFEKRVQSDTDTKEDT